MVHFKSLLVVLTTILMIGLQNFAFSQDVSIELGKTEIAINESFQITATVKNSPLQEVTGFPEIPGMTKAGTSSASSVTMVNGHISNVNSLSQNYRPEKEGTYVIKPFILKINGKTIKHNGATIKVTGERSYEPFEDMWGVGRESGNEQFLDIKEDAFFAIMPNKTDVFQGEGFNMSIAFYVAEQNRAILDFYEVGEQLAEILKKVKPENCWEENFGIEEIVPELVTINGKPYRQYKIYQANFYPLNTEPIVIPSVPFKMIKFKISANNSIFGQSHVKDFKIFNSAEKRVRVKPLPEHPLKNQVAVGTFRLIEGISPEALSTGQSFNYRFEIGGEGNIASIRPPDVPQSKHFDFYAPNERSQITRSDNAVFGSKQFNFMAIPNEPGSYSMGDYFEWVYFNPKTAKYDTLKSSLTIKVTGESKTNYAIESNETGGFYNRIEEESNELVKADGRSWSQVLFNAVMLFLVVATVFMMVRKKENQQKEEKK